MNCPAVRDLLAEHALGALPARDTDAIDRHVAWCAACRKEASELHTAAAILAFSVAPAEPGPDPDLEDRVVHAVQRSVQRRPVQHVAPSRGRLAVAAVVAAMLAVSGLGWGAVMAGRAARSDEAAQAQTDAAENAAVRFRHLLETVEGADPEGDVYLATLAPAAEGGGGGSALTLVSPSIRDMAVVLVNGVPSAERKGAPFTARLRGPRGLHLTVGTIRSLDASGSGIVVRDFDRDLGEFHTVIVRDASGNIVMRGTISSGAPIASPTP